MRDHAGFQKGRADSEHSAVNAKKSPGGHFFVAHSVLHANDRSLLGKCFAQRLNRSGALRRFDREDDDVAEARSDLARMSDCAQGFDHAVAVAGFDEKPAAIVGGAMTIYGEQTRSRAAPCKASAEAAAVSTRSENARP